MSAPLLLTDGYDDLALSQINHQACERQDFGDLFACHLDAWGMPNGLPAWVYALGRVGCVFINCSTFNEVRNGDIYADFTILLFRDQDEFRAAWSIARRLKKATQGNPALITNEDWSRLTYAYYSSRHCLLWSPVDLTGGGL